MDFASNPRFQPHTERMRRSLKHPRISGDPTLQMYLVQRSYLMHLLHHVIDNPLMDGMPSVDLLIRMELDDRYRIGTDEQFLRDVEGDMTQEERETFRESVLRQFLDRNKQRGGQSDPYEPLDTLTPKAQRYLDELH